MFCDEPRLCLLRYKPRLVSLQAATALNDIDETRTNCEGNSLQSISRLKVSSCEMVPEGLEFVVVAGVAEVGKTVEVGMEEQSTGQAPLPPPQLQLQCPSRQGSSRISSKSEWPQWLQLWVIALLHDSVGVATGGLSTSDWLCCTSSGPMAPKQWGIRSRQHTAPDPRCIDGQQLNTWRHLKASMDRPALF